MDLSALRTHGIIPDVIDNEPTKVVNVVFDDGPTEMGTIFTTRQVAKEPKISFEADPNKLYALLHVDPDAPGRALPFLRSVLHWLVVNVPGDDLSKGDVCCEYRGSGAPPLTGMHRYVFLVYEQPGELQYGERVIKADGIRGRMRFSPANFASSYKLSQPIAANFYQCQHTW